MNFYLGLESNQCWLIVRAAARILKESFENFYFILTKQSELKKKTINVSVSMLDEKPSLAYLLPFSVLRYYYMIYVYKGKDQTALLC